MPLVLDTTTGQMVWSGDAVPAANRSNITATIANHESRLDEVEGKIGTTDGIVVATLPVILPTYTVSTLPSASTYARGLIYVSNGTSNKRLAISDGTNWRFPDGNVVS